MAQAPITRGLERRHFYECAGETLSWRGEWYTEPWFTSQRQSYDRAASTGPVDPPLDIIATVSACARAYSAAGIPLLTSGITTRSGVSATGGSNTAAGVVAGGSIVASRTSAATAAETASPSGSRSNAGGLTPVAESPVAPTPTPSPSSFTASLTSTVSLDSSFTSISSSSASVSTDFGNAFDTSSINACAGDWDRQGWATVASLGIGILLGGVLWILWAVLRKLMPGFYSPRTWFVPSGDRPSKPFSLLAFLLPFIHLPSLSTGRPVSDGVISVHAMYTSFKLAALVSLLALAAALPLFTIGVPCLSSTSPSNTQGGRTGTLTDLSLMRLLNALDPSPGSASTSNLLHLAPYIRALPSTIAPAVNNARVRLIILLVILAVLGCGGGLFVIARSYAALARYRRRFEEDICGGLDMVVVSAEDAPAWKGLSDAQLRKWLKSWQEPMKQEGGDGVRELEVVGIFAIPDTKAWLHKIEEREAALHGLEEAVARHADSGSLVSQRARTHDWWTENPGRPPGPQVIEPSPAVIARPPSTHPLLPEESPQQDDETQPSALGAGNSRFVEINRDSAQYSRRFSIGQRVKVDEAGQCVPDPSPDSENGNPISSTGHGSTDTHDSATSTPGAEHVPNSGHSPQHIAQGDLTHSSSARGEEYADVRDHRIGLLALNAEIEQHQQEAFASVAKGEGIRGWVLVGRGMRYFPHARQIDGRTKQDIIWANIDARPRTEVFWLKVLLVGIGLSIIIIPFIGLTVATAPGFAHYLGFLRPLATSDGFGSGIAQGLVPALALCLAVSLAVYAVSRFSKQVKLVSRSAQQILAYKAVFYLLLFTMLFWLITVSALDYAVQSFDLEVQQARYVGDGAVFSTWFVFVTLLNLAIIVPAIYLLQPRRLWRYLRRRSRAKTPRQRYRLFEPASFRPAYAMIPFLIAVFYAFSLIFLFPLLAIPIFLLLFLSMVANRHMVDYAFVERSGGYSGATLALWTIRRFGWVLCVQPFLFGLILLGRREWGLGGASIGVSVINVVLSELLTVRRYPSPGRSHLSDRSRRALDTAKSDLLVQTTDAAHNTGAAATNGAEAPRSVHRISDSSMLARLTALLPGYTSRLPVDCPLPLPTDDVNDMFQTEKASRTKPEFASHRNEEDTDDTPPVFFYDQTEATKGLIYPPELLATSPVVWLPSDEGKGVMEREALRLSGQYGLFVITDLEKPKRHDKKVSEGTEAASPLLSGRA